MKFIGIMSVADDVRDVKRIFEKHDVEVFSEVDIKGHTYATLKEHGWIPTEKDIPVYSKLCFAIIAKYRADEIMKEIGAQIKEVASGHPLRVFQMDVENMI